jgi:hypothetical protein
LGQGESATKGAAEARSSHNTSIANWLLQMICLSAADSDRFGLLYYSWQRVSALRFPGAEIANGNILGEEILSVFAVSSCEADI